MKRATDVCWWPSPRSDGLICNRPASTFVIWREGDRQTGWLVCAAHRRAAEKHHHVTPEKGTPR